MYDNPNATAPVPPGEANPAGTELSPPAVQRFQTCRWRRQPENGNTLEYCTHRDVQPMAGTTGFDPRAWCLDCEFYKIRRTPRKRQPEEYRY